MTAPTLNGQVLPGLGSTPLDRVLRTIALAHIDGLTARDILDAALLVIDGATPTDAIDATQGPATPRLARVSQAGTALIQQARRNA